jgi:hypothetical protein
MPRRTDPRASSRTVVLAVAASASLLLSACSSSWVTGSSSGPAAGSTGGGTTSSSPTTSSGPTASSSATPSTAAGGAGNIARVSCQGDSCSLVLAGRETRVQVFESTISFVAVREGEATLQVDQQDVTCTEGSDIAAGSLSISCTRVTDDRVEFTARPA